MEEKYYELNKVVLELIEASADSIALTLYEHNIVFRGELQCSEVVLDGFCNPIELQSFPKKTMQCFCGCIAVGGESKPSGINITQNPIN